MPLAGGAPVDVGLPEVRLLAEFGGPVLAADASPQDLLVLEAARFPRRGENVPNRLGESLRVMLRMICEEVFQRCHVSLDAIELAESLKVKTVCLPIRSVSLIRVRRRYTCKIYENM